MNEEILNQNVTTQNGGTLYVTDSMKVDLLSAAKWAKFLCIVGCVAVGFMLIAAFCMLVFGAMFANNVFSGLPIGPAMGVLYIVIAALYIYPIIKGFQFANGVKAACLQNDQYQMARGFAGMNSLLRYLGVLTIIIIAIYAITLVFTVGFAAIGLAAMH